MFRKLHKNKKAQQTAEYALLIALVVAAVIAMQTYAQRTIQARIRSASQHLALSTGDLGDTNLQYEPYYLTSEYQVSRDDTTTQLHDNTTVRKEVESERTRAAGGYQTSTYELDDTTGW